MTTETATRPETVLFQVKLPAEIIENVDREAAKELITRTAWIRRLLHQVAKPETA